MGGDGKHRASLGVAMCVLGALAAYVALSGRRGMVAVRSGVNGKEYMVRRAGDSGAAADRLAVLEQRLRRLLEGAATIMPDDPRVAAIWRRWDGTLAEVEAADEVAFSIDKTSVHLCLRDASGRVEDLNASTFVMLHELAHVATADYGHSPEFWANMRFLLELAERLGVYTYENYDAKRTTFCGHPLGASPLTCLRSRTCRSALPSP
jgi:plasmid maintenance system antidote protein VapI